MKRESSVVFVCKQMTRHDVEYWREIRNVPFASSNPYSDRLSWINAIMRFVPPVYEIGVAFNPQPHQRVRSVDKRYLI
jgi:hypothetical protein